MILPSAIMLDNQDFGLPDLLLFKIIDEFSAVVCAFGIAIYVSVMDTGDFIGGIFYCISVYNAYPHG